MPLVRRIAAIGFLAVWLPALLHCRLESAGVLFESKCCGAPERPAVPVADHGCAGDLCNVAEGAFTRPDDATDFGPAGCDGRLCRLGAAESVALPPVTAAGPLTAETTAPPDLCRPWALRVRGTATPQAP